MAVKVENIYYLLAYAWEFWAAGESVDIAPLHGADATNLLALLLNAGTRRAIRRGLHQDYQSREEVRAGLRGRILLCDSDRQGLLARGLAKCLFDDLNHSSLPNQIIKSTLERVVEAECLDQTLQKEIGSTLRELRPIPSIRLSAGVFRRVRSNRSNAHYQLLVSICELLFRCELPSERDGAMRFRNFCDDEVFMHALFEEFVRNFYKTHAHEKGMTCLGSKRIAWNLTSTGEEARGLIPEMRTDLSLENDTRHLIVDCKFYPEALAGRFSPKLRSEHLYQLWTYVSQQRAAERNRYCEGLLLYPSVDVDLMLEWSVEGHRMRAATLDLNREWKEIRAQLLSLL